MKAQSKGLRRSAIWLCAGLLFACGGEDPSETDGDDDPGPTTPQPEAEPGEPDPSPTVEPSPGAEPEPAAEPSPEPASGPSPEPSPDVPAPEPEPESSNEAPYLPLAEGVTWTYDVTKDGVVTRKVTTVDALEPVGGTGPNADVMAFRVTTLKDDGNDETVSWQVRQGDLAVRYREQGFGPAGLEIEEHWAPYKLRLDESERGTMVGSMFQEQYEETKLEVGMPVVTGPRIDTWTVLGTDVEVTVPAGTFDCLHVRKIGATSTKEYWFARGVGKVKEVGGQIEELDSYEVP